MSRDTTKYAYEVHQPPFDQNADNPKEAERLTSLYPDEPELLEDVFSVRVPLYDEMVRCASRSITEGVSCPVDHLKIPPYCTTEPEVTTFEGARREEFSCPGFGWFMGVFDE